MKHPFPTIEWVLFFPEEQNTSTNDHLVIHGSSPPSDLFSCESVQCKSSVNIWRFYHEALYYTRTETILNFHHSAVQNLNKHTHPSYSSSPQHSFSKWSTNIYIFPLFLSSGTNRANQVTNHLTKQPMRIKSPPPSILFLVCSLPTPWTLHQPRTRTTTTTSVDRRK